MPSSPSTQRRLPWLPDVIAGLSIAGLLLTEAIAYASIAGLPAQAGIIALLVGLISYGLIGRSRYAIVSATSSSAAVLAAAIASMQLHDLGLQITLAVGLVMLTGVFFLLASFFRLGGLLADFIAKPVLRGFAFGLSLVIIIRQIPKIVAIQVPTHSNLLSFGYQLLQRWADWNSYGILLALAALSLLLLFGRIRHLPATLIVIVLSIVLQRWIDLDAYAIEQVGPISLFLIEPVIPDLEQSQWLRLAELAVAMVFILYAESFGAIQTYALKHGNKTSPDRDLLALGVANIISGILHGLPVGAGFSATTANETAGAESRLAGLLSALVVLGIVLSLLPQIALIPEPVLAAVVIYAVGHALNLRVLHFYWVLQRDRIVVLSSIACVLLFGVLDGLLAGVIISLAMMLRRWSAASISVLGRLNGSHDFTHILLHPAAKELPGILIVRPEEPLFFANINRVLQQVQQALACRTGIHSIILSMEESPDLDSTTVEALLEFAKMHAEHARQLLFVRLKESAHDVLQRTAIETIAHTRLLDLSVDSAVTLLVDAGSAQSTH